MLSSTVCNKSRPWYKLSEYFNHAVGKCHKASATETCRDPAQLHLVRASQQSVAGVQNCRARLTPRLIDAKPQEWEADRHTDRHTYMHTHRQAAGNNRCNIIIAAGWVKCAEETRREIKAVTYLKDTKKCAVTPVQTFGGSCLEQHAEMSVIQTVQSVVALSERPLSKLRKQQMIRYRYKNSQPDFHSTLMWKVAVKLVDNEGKCFKKKRRETVQGPCASAPLWFCAPDQSGLRSRASRRHQVLIYITAPAVSNHSSEQGVWLNIPAGAPSNQSLLWAGPVTLTTL